MALNRKHNIRIMRRLWAKWTVGVQTRVSQARPVAHIPFCGPSAAHGKYFCFKAAEAVSFQTMCRLIYFLVYIISCIIQALTATATSAVRKDVQKILRMRHTEMFVGSFNRPNLIYTVKEKPKKVSRYEGEAVCEPLTRLDAQK